MKKFLLSPYQLINLSTICLLFAIIGCATLPPTPEWLLPPPPNKPRLKYLYEISSELDFYRAGKQPFLQQVWGWLMGKPPPVPVLQNPYDLCADKEGRIYVTNGDHIVVFDRGKKRIFTFGKGYLLDAAGVDTDGEGRFYVADAAEARVKVFRHDGYLLFAFGHPGKGAGEFIRPTGLAINKQRGTIFVVDSGKPQVQAYDLFGNFLYEFGTELIVPNYIAVDKEGKIYVVDTFAANFHVYDVAGKHLSIFGQPGDTLGNFGRPKGVSVDSDLNIYIADAMFNVVQILNQEGQPCYFFYGIPPLLMALPTGLYIDEKDRLYVLDVWNQRVQVYQYLK